MRGGHVAPERQAIAPAARADVVDRMACLANAAQVYRALAERAAFLARPGPVHTIEAQTTGVGKDSRPWREPPVAANLVGGP